MPATCGGIAALLFLSIIGYFFWRGTVVVMNARRLINEQGALLLDVSPRAQFTAMHIAGSVNILAADVALHQAELGSVDRPIVVYARSGFQSARAAHVLRSVGYQRVVNVGTMGRWGAPASMQWQGGPPPKAVKPPLVGSTV
jgi:phage shock protein E